MGQEARSPGISLCVCETGWRRSADRSGGVHLEIPGAGEQDESSGSRPWRCEWLRPKERSPSMKSLTPWCPEALRERRIGGRSTAAHRTASTRMTSIATVVFPALRLVPPHPASPGDVRPARRRSVVDRPCKHKARSLGISLVEQQPYQRPPGALQALEPALVQVRGLFADFPPANGR